MFTVYVGIWLYQYLSSIFSYHLYCQHCLKVCIHVDFSVSKWLSHRSAKWGSHMRPECLVTLWNAGDPVGPGNRRGQFMGDEIHLLNRCVLWCSPKYKILNFSVTKCRLTQMTLWWAFRCSQRRCLIYLVNLWEIARTHPGVAWFVCLFRSSELHILRSCLPTFPACSWPLQNSPASDHMNQSNKSHHNYIYILLVYFSGEPWLIQYSIIVLY